MPHFVSEPNIQLWMRDKLVSSKEYKNELANMFLEIKNTNTLANTIDEKVIFDTAWQIYGCCKKNIPYKLKYIYGIKKVEEIEKDDVVFDFDKKLVFREKNSKK